MTYRRATWRIAAVGPWRCWCRPVRRNRESGSSSRDRSRVDALHRYPDSLAVVGHSQATGENTTPYENGDTKTNTWASGTNPAVRSIYLRILAAHPQIKGHVTNAAQGGATIADIEQQARGVAASHPDLPLVQAIDNDLTCPATPADVRPTAEVSHHFSTPWKSASPSTQVFMVSQYGSPRTYVQSLTLAQRRDLAATMGPPGPCVFVDPDGNLVPKETRRLERIIVAYEHIQAKVCDAHRNCAHDHGAFSNAVERPGDYTDDLNHLSIQGHARAAALAWRALQHDGLVRPEKGDVTSASHRTAQASRSPRIASCVKTPDGRAQSRTAPGAAEERPQCGM